MQRVDQQRARALLGALTLNTLAVLAGAALTALSGWLIVRAAQQPGLMYLLVAITGVRFFGLARAGFRYAERLRTHDLALRAADALALRSGVRIGMPAAQARALVPGPVLLDADPAADALALERLALWALRGLTALEPGFDVEARDGELWVRSPYVSAGYLEPGHELRREGGWVTVGDRGEVLDGRVIVHGRAGGITTAGATVRVADIRAWPATWPPKVR